MSARPYMADVKFAKFDAIMDAQETTVRVFFYAPDLPNDPHRGASPIDFGRVGGIPGEMIGGYLYRPRDFDRIAGETRPTIQAVVRPPYTAELLREVSNILIVDRGRAAGRWHRANIFGVRNVPSEVVLGWELAEILDDEPIPLRPLTLESGSPLLTELGSPLTMEVAL